MDVFPYSELDVDEAPFLTSPYNTKLDSYEASTFLLDDEMASDYPDVTHSSHFSTTSSSCASEDEHSQQPYSTTQELDAMPTGQKVQPTVTGTAVFQPSLNGNQTVPCAPPSQDELNVEVTAAPFEFIPLVTQMRANPIINANTTVHQKQQEQHSPLSVESVSVSVDCIERPSTATNKSRKRGRPKKQASNSPSAEHSDDSCKFSSITLKKFRTSTCSNSVDSLVINKREHALTKLIGSGEHSEGEMSGIVATSNQNKVVDELLTAAVQSGKEVATAAVDNKVITALIEEAAIKRVRLARKAELARLSRCKKKSRLHELEEENVKLKKEIEQLKQHDTAMTAKQEPTQFQVQAIELSASEAQSLDACIEQVLSSASINAQHVNACIDAVLAVQQHNRELLQNTLSTLATFTQQPVSVHYAFLVWIMSRNDKFVADESGLWYELWQSTLQCDGEQIGKLLQLRVQMQQQQAKAEQCIPNTMTFDALTKHLTQQQSQATENLSALTQILGAHQLYAYFKWCSQFGHICIKINS